MDRDRSQADRSGCHSSKSLLQPILAIFPFCLFGTIRSWFFFSTSSSSSCPPHHVIVLRKGGDQAKTTATISTAVSRLFGVSHTICLCTSCPALAGSATISAENRKSERGTEPQKSASTHHLLFLTVFSQTRLEMETLPDLLLCRLLSNNDQNDKPLGQRNIHATHAAQS